jgi:hypothetical protein
VGSRASGLAALSPWLEKYSSQRAGKWPQIAQLSLSTKSAKGGHMQKQRLFTAAMLNLLSGNYLASQVRTMVACVFGLLKCKVVSLTTIGDALPGRAKVKHKIKRVDRFLGNKLIDIKPLCGPMLLALLKGATSLLVSVDWTEIDDFQVLVFAVTTRYGRSVPVYWEVIDTDEDRMKAVEVAAISRFAALVPQEMKGKITIAADRGFDEVKFISAVAKHFGYVIRLSKGNTISAKFDGVFTTLAESLTVKDQAVDFGTACFTQEHMFQTRIIGLHDHNQKDPWFLATSLTQEARTIARYYARRFDIEHAFRDWKSARYGLQLGSIKCSSPERLARLLLILAVAYLLLVLLGLLGEDRELQWDFQASSRGAKSRQGRRVRALWRVGMSLFKQPRLPFNAVETLLSYFESLAFNCAVC